jgi:hypothetical protein
MPSLYEFYQEKEIRELTNTINSAKYISEEQKEAMVAELSVVSEASKKTDFLWLDSAGLYFNQVTAAFYTASTFDYEEGPRGGTAYRKILTKLKGKDKDHVKKHLIHFIKRGGLVKKREVEPLIDVDADDFNQMKNIL